MPLSPIQMFQNSGQNSIEGLLKAGPEAISNIMNQAIQIGRSMSDKQLAQERDLFAMRQQETNLMQRRAENLEQGNKDALRFGRAVFESDRRYDLDSRKFEAASTGQDRLSANDAFSQDIAQRRMSLAEDKFNYDKDLTEEEKARRIEAQRLFDRGNAPAEEALPVVDEFKEPAAVEEIEPTSTDNPRIDELNVKIDKNKENLGRLTTPTSEPFRKRIREDIFDLEKERTALSKTPKDARPSSSDIFAPLPGAPETTKETSAPSDPVRDKVSRQSEFEAQSRNTDLRPEQRARAKKQADLLTFDISEARKNSTKDKADKAPTVAAEEREAKGFLMNETAFAPQSQFVGKTTTKEEAKAYDDDKMKSELNSALNAESEEKYVSMVGKNATAADKEVRRKFYRYALKTGRDEGGSSAELPRGSIWDQVPR